VRVVEPFAFTKVSALGVEEQRVNVIADFVDSPGPLGDAYRVEARVIVWQSDNVIKAPASALFRHGDGWAVFVVDADRARLRPVSLGQRAMLEVEVSKGLQPGERVIVHPPREIADGVRVKARAG
jgi:HlyD family secretion protein